MKGIAVYLLITKHFYNNFKEKESDLRMATNRKLRILLKKIYPNGNIDTIFFKSRAKDVLVDESGTETLADIVEKVNDMNEGATKVEDSSTNGNIKINGTETNVYTHPNSGATAGTYNSVTVNAQGHVTAGTKVTNWTGTVSGNISNGTNTITKASTRANLTTGEKLSVSLGKVMKWFADLKSLAFVDKVGTANLDTTLTTAYNNRVTTDKVTTSTSITASGWVADARAVATLQNQINTINSNLGGFKVYKTLGDIGISSSSTTLQNVFKAFDNIGDQIIFIYNQGALTSGITDMPVGYGQLQLIKAQGRISVWYTTGNTSYYFADNNNIQNRTADDLIPIPSVINNLTSSTVSYKEALSAYQGYVLNNSVQRLYQQYRVLYIDNQTNKFLVIEFETVYGYISILYSCPYFSGLISIRLPSLTTSITQTNGISHMPFTGTRSDDISGMIINYVAAVKNSGSGYRVKIAFSDNIPASCYILLGDTSSANIYSQAS